MIVFIECKKREINTLLEVNINFKGTGYWLEKKEVASVVLVIYVFLIYRGSVQFSSGTQ